MNSLKIDVEIDKWKDILSQLKKGNRLRVKVIGTAVGSNRILLSLRGVTRINIEDPIIYYQRKRVEELEDIIITNLRRENDYMIEIRLTNTTRRRLLLEQNLE